jgi:hypothetical protein
MISHLTSFLILPLGQSELNQTPVQSLSWLTIHTYRSSQRLFSVSVDSEKNKQKTIYLPSGKVAHYCFQPGCLTSAFQQPCTVISQSFIQ